MGSLYVRPQVEVKFGFLALVSGAKRRYDFCVLICEHSSQVELELALLNVPDNGRRVRTQPRG
jgi:hypothetical protein